MNHVRFLRRTGCGGNVSTLKQFRMWEIIPTSVTSLWLVPPSIRYGVIATGNQWILIRCAEHHPREKALTAVDVHHAKWFQMSWQTSSKR